MKFVLLNLYLIYLLFKLCIINAGTKNLSKKTYKIKSQATNSFSKSKKKKKFLSSLNFSEDGNETSNDNEDKNLSMKDQHNSKRELGDNKNEFRIDYSNTNEEKNSIEDTQSHEKLFKFHQPNHKKTIEEMKRKKKIQHNDKALETDEDDEMGYLGDYDPLNR